MTANYEREFTEAYGELRKDPDRSKALCIHALLGYDDGRTYTEHDYEKAIEHLEMGMKDIAGGSSDFFSEAIRWCQTRAKSLQSA